MPAAANLLGRAISLLDRTSDERRRLLNDHAEALGQIGDFAAATAVLAEAEALATEVDDSRLHAETVIQKSLLSWMTESDESYAHLTEPLEAAVDVLAGLGVHRYAAKGLRLLGLLHVGAGRHADAQDVLSRAVDHADASGDRRTQVQVRSTRVQSILDDPTPVPDAIAACIDLADRAPEDRWTQALVHHELARLRAMTGEFAAARRDYRVAHTLFESLGARVARALASDGAGEVELLADNPAEAERQLRVGYDVLLALDSRNFLSTVAARLADAVATQGRCAEAEELTRVSEEAAADDDVFSHVLWRMVRARCCDETRVEEAVALADAAVRLAGSVDSPPLLGMALLERASLAQRWDDPELAAEAGRAARDAFARKGFTVGVDRAARLLAALPVGGRGGLPSPRIDLTIVSNAETAVPPA
jgi:tetratricopeptide (TPR) repeat protein